jgi:hypothetical protein
MYTLYNNPASLVYIIESEADLPSPPIILLKAGSEKVSKVFGRFNYYPYLCGIKRITLNVRL